MWPEKMRAWASMAEDPLKRASAASSSSTSPLRRYSPATLAAGGLLVGAVAYFMFKGKQGQGRQGDQPVRRP
ncbi:uncharacterized LOC112939307 [Oryza sativa Japonica Group]|jgi:type VI protein secretion system component VasF|uniref:Os06g0650700 protein n=5 Tax=Oryza TaxID=4527 RepID=B9FQ89_ORYSJ|nr:uncharacterized LOC112939307 [Oryza sativa Japonica Group]KAB8103335.1 hypothetical protein EE612_035705 [Oryza sativa]EEE66131.1 hypothetical protein OsJ_22178 [Oryza sativa Japonica Group]KAF2927845.1 hypothetical protein DAI22_06g235000 [Oryza sativa Japonica Group]BAD38111.1 unknown protein [Oryza sativa Japonica Group]BAH93661.1 Os06g0650700 [Oryza sativa Japonica Group]|eukprot:NP_001174933.1 Os06g0650700 [Oryza sativa Japonica Group]